MRPLFMKQMSRRVKIFVSLFLIFAIWFAWYYQHRKRVRAEQRAVLNQLIEVGYKVDQFPPDSLVSDDLHRIGKLLSQFAGEAVPFRVYVSLEAPTKITSENLIEHATLVNQLEYDVGLTFKNCDQLTNLNGLSNSPNLWDLWIESCPKLTDLSGLKGNKTLRMVMVSECPQFTHLNGLKELDSLEFIFLDQLDGLTDISFTYDLTNLAHLEINECRHFGSRSWDPDMGYTVEEYLFSD